MGTKGLDSGVVEPENQQPQQSPALRPLVPEAQNSIGKTHVSTRRNFLRELVSTGGMVATGIVGLSACSNNSNGEIVRKDRKVDTGAEGVADAAPEPSIDDIRESLKQKYPEELKGNLLALAEDPELQDDPDVKDYFLTATYEDLLEDKIIRPGTLPHLYANLESAWQNKTSNPKRCHPLLKQECEQARKNLGSFKNEGELTYESFRAIAQKIQEQVKAQMAKSDFPLKSLSTAFDDMVDEDLLVGIAIHELMPQKSRYKVEMSDMARIGILRALLEKGVEINKIPALFDNQLSFGIFQMTTIPYEGRMVKYRPIVDKKRTVALRRRIDRRNKRRCRKKKYKFKPSNAKVYKRNKRGRIVKEAYIYEESHPKLKPYLKEFGLPEKLHDCTSIEDQLKAGLLLSMSNLKRAEEMLLNSPKFISLWNSETTLPEERRAFIAAYVAAAHHANGTALLALKKALEFEGPEATEINTLEKFREYYSLIISQNDFGRAKGAASLTARHSRRSSNLVKRFASWSIDRVGKGIACILPSRKKKPEAPPVKPTVITKAATQHTVPETRREIAKNLQPVKTRKPLGMMRSIHKGKPAYAFNVPNWKLSRLIEALCGSSDDFLVRRLKEFNGVKRLIVGQVFHIPIDMLRPSLRAPGLSKFLVPNNMKPSDLLKQILAEPTNQNMDLAILYLANIKAENVDELGKTIYLPSALLHK